MALAELATPVPAEPHVQLQWEIPQVSPIHKYLAANAVESSEYNYWQNENGRVSERSIIEKAGIVAKMHNAQAEAGEVFEFVRRARHIVPDWEEITEEPNKLERLRKKVALDGHAVDVSFIVGDRDEFGGDRVLMFINGLKTFYEIGWNGGVVKEDVRDVDYSDPEKPKTFVHTVTKPMLKSDSSFVKKVTEAVFKRNIKTDHHPEKDYQFLEEWEEEPIRGPEGLTGEQEKLAAMIFDTKVEAPIGRRETNPDGSYTFSKETRPVSILEFARDDNEFVQADHAQHPEMPLSPYYFNFRNLPEDVRKQIATVFRQMGPVQSDFITGIPNAGMVLAKDYARFSGAIYIDAFSKVEDKDNKTYVVPIDNLKGDGDVCLIDDVLAQGNRKREAIEAAKQVGLNVREILFIVDREQRHQLPDYIDVKCAMTLSQLLLFGIRTGRITEDQYEKVMAFNALRDKLDESYLEKNFEELIPHPSLSVE